TYLCHDTSHITWPNPLTRPLCIDTSCCNHNTRIFALRIFILLLLHFFSQLQQPFPSTATDGGRYSVVFLAHSSLEIFSASSATSFAILSTSEWAHCHSLQCGAYTRRYDMAYSTWNGIDRLCCRLEPSSREYFIRCGMVRWGRRERNRGHRTTEEANSYGMQ